MKLRTAFDRKLCGLDAQVDSLLAGMPLAEDARAIRSAADASWQQLQGVLGGRAAAAAFAGRQPARADCQWAFSMLLSRLIRSVAFLQGELLPVWNPCEQPTWHF